MKIKVKDRLNIIDASLGKIENDLVIINVNLLNLFTGEIYPVNVYSFNGIIVDVQTDNLGIIKPSKNIYDGKGNYIIPGFIDSHVHIESSMLTPRNFAKSVIPWGTTTVITDPHEISNVFGKDGFMYMYNSSENLPMRQFIHIPSCIPSVLNLEESGAFFDSIVIDQLSKLDRVIGLAEVMDFIGVIEKDKRIHDILDCADDNNLFIQGHSPMLTGKNLAAYIAAGIESCHETITSKEAIEKLRNGMYLDIRESSISKNAKAILEGVKDSKYFENITLCTDDREPDDLLNIGHMNDVVSSVIKEGMNNIDAIKSATLNVARQVGIKNLGAIAPGYIADMQIISDLNNPRAFAVFFNGNLVSEDGILIDNISNKDYDIEDKNSINIKFFEKKNLRIKAPIENGTITVNVMMYETLFSSRTKLSVESLNVKDGYLDISNDNNLKFVCIINRYGKNNFTVGVVRNFGISKGSIGSTVSHDCHNLTIVYDNFIDAEVIIESILESGGGISAAIDGHLREIIKLPIGGLMSKKDALSISKEISNMKKILMEFGITEMKNPLLRIVTLALPVIPEVKFSDKGLIDVLNKKFIPLFPK
ncbi:MAG: adenine deaminase [Oscillospiraceae bacterium]|nr:adenine deaminase [Oscillospiraceae bacterium]